MKKVDVEEYLLHEGCNYLTKLVRKWHPNYIKTMFYSISDDELINLLRDKGIHKVIMD